MSTLGVNKGSHMGVIGDPNISYGKFMGTLGGHRGLECEVQEVYGHPRDHRGCMYEGV